MKRDYKYSPNKDLLSGKSEKITFSSSGKREKSESISKALDKKKVSESNRAYNKERKYLEGRGISREAFKGGQVS